MPRQGADRVSRAMNIRPTDIMVLDSLFDMGGGYVLNFSIKMFSEFFYRELNIDRHT
jgi:hypothetical protein